MARKRKNETEDERRERVKKNAQELRKAGDREDDDLDALVRKSIELHGP